MATRTIKTLGKTGRITRARAFKAAKKVLHATPKATTKESRRILTPAATASGKGLIKFRVGTQVPARH